MPGPRRRNCLKCAFAITPFLVDESASIAKAFGRLPSDLVWAWLKEYHDSGHPYEARASITGEKRGA